MAKNQNQQSKGIKKWLIIAGAVVLVAITLGIVIPKVLKKPEQTPPPQTGEEDPDKEDPDKEDPGKEDPGKEDPGKEDPGKEDPGKEDPDPTEKTIIEQINDAIANHQKTENEAGYPAGATFVGARPIVMGSTAVFQIILELPNGEVISRYTTDSINNVDLFDTFGAQSPYIRQIGGNSNSKNDGTPNDFAIMFTENTISEKDYYDLILSLIESQPARNGTGILIATGLTGGDANNVSQSISHYGAWGNPATHRYITTQERWDELVAQHGSASNAAAAMNAEVIIIPDSNGNVVKITLEEEERV